MNGRFDINNFWENKIDEDETLVFIQNIKKFQSFFEWIIFWQSLLPFTWMKLRVLPNFVV